MVDERLWRRCGQAMTDFSARWLDLREPLDAASRADELAGFLRPTLKPGARASRREIVDLGAGTGANLRCSALLLGGSQDWQLIERDPLLLGAMEDRLHSWAHSVHARFEAEGRQFAVRGAQFECEVRPLALDLATSLDLLTLSRGALLTACALLDLVSEPWLRLAIARAAAATAAVWFTLIYDGRIDFDPAEPEDAQVRQLVNQHQRGDKGFGPALGPAAGRLALRLLSEQGYRVHCEASDWHIGADHPQLQYALIEGWFEAACEIAPDSTAQLRAWRARRLAHVDGRLSRLSVGHVDIVARPHG